MTFEIEVNGHTRSVAVEQAGPGRFRVTVDGVEHFVDAFRVGEFALSMIVDGDGAVSREAQVVPGSAPGEALIWLDGRTVAAAIDGRRRRRSRDEGGSGADGVQTVVAPMPGRIVRVLVEPGDDVAVRQPLVVVEAMKMENELRSPKAGRVKDVSVAAGTSVEAGRVLVVIE
jgi:biotin carboxyl carrier protein